LIPIAPRTWRSWDDVVDLFAGPADVAWEHDRQEIDDAVRDPWE